MANETGARDKIRIHNLKLPCLLGVYDEERSAPQDIIINLTLLADLHTSCHTDNLSDTVDYHTLEKQIIEYTSQTSFYLIEKLADQLIRLGLENPRVQEVCCRIEKPAAPEHARSISVEIKRRREDYE